MYSYCLAVAVLALTMACAGSPKTSQKQISNDSRIPLILDTDVALGEYKVRKNGQKTPRDVDDGLAVVEAINSPKIRLVGVTTVFGNCPTSEIGMDVAKKLTTMKGQEIPVHAGRNTKLTQDEINNPRLIPETSAYTYLRETLREADRPITIAAIGPLTNIATLVLKNREMRGKIKEVIVVMGRSPGVEFAIGSGAKKKKGIRDFNYVKDPLAVKALMESGVPVVFTPFELSVQATITPEALKKIKDNHQTPTSNMLFQKSQAWMKYWMDGLGDTGFHPWDSAAIAYLAHPEMMVCENRAFQFRPIDVSKKSAWEKKQDEKRSSIEDSYLELASEYQIDRLPEEYQSGYQSGPFKFCHGFANGDSRAFVKKVMDGVY